MASVERIIWYDFNGFLHVEIFVEEPYFSAKKLLDERWEVVRAVGISVGITSLAGTPFFGKRGAGCIKKGAGAPFFLKKGASAPFLREKGVPAKKMIPKCTDQDFLWYRYGKYQEIPTDTNRKIPIR